MRLVILGMAALAAGCSSGGNGGGGTPTPTPTPPPTNRAPTFTSATTASVAENTAAAYTATASDPDGNPLTFSIAGGADATRFTITPAGALTFAPAPNFELPADADGDNVYRVQLQVSDGSLTATQDVAITVTDSREGIAVRRVGAGFSQPLYVAPIPGSAQVYVVEKGGGILRLDPATGVKTLVRTVGSLATDGERGLLGLVVNTNAPATYGEALVVATAPDGAVELRSLSLSSPAAPYIVVLRTPHPTNNNHNGGWLGFGPDGHLYMAIGDGGGSGDPGNNAQNTNVRLGKILRLAQSGGNYVPAPGNPFLAGGGDPHVFAFGLRNPFRASFAPDGRLIIGDVGQGAREEIDVLRPDQPGLNFGWRFLEGTQPFSGTAPAGLTAPVTEYTHGTGPRQGRSVIGGYVYRGPVTSLIGAYVFGDFISGNIWSVPATSLVAGSTLASSSYERRNTDFTPDAGTINQLASFGEDAAGNLYIVDLDGEIFMVTPG
ncbi:PQQ-dependent sugar dehydrogenase [Sphingomonas sp. BT-65]|uniref:PQQ-dependent sugar dehydrogenase n=1 Tax=Sphingomonas sp. BT-65 TaxID=2989821 RepID=UPI002235628F|nr:PQQ-dependent sugar dehydrogenase [Sphingomonas sp. BT-65]MCW4463172.1 PQQ-dependent sugar dehydrogenase [Sphingomonas sp. BT-65]